MCSSDLDVQLLGILGVELGLLSCRLKDRVLAILEVSSHVSSLLRSESQDASRPSVVAGCIGMLLIASQVAMALRGGALSSPPCPVS